ncbi:MAG: hypothetical protein ABEJ02_04480 [Candidatus Paceibacteria bacterium]
MSDFEDKLIQTLSFFHIFNHPLTPQELHRFLWKKRVSFSKFQEKLSEIDGPLQFKDGFYYLKQEDIDNRQSRVRLVKKKTEIAKKAARKLTWIPFLKAVFICNTLASKTVDEDSDIDFFIIAQKDRVWLVRFFANLILKLFRLRVGEDKYADNICLSFFSSADKLDFSNITIDQPDVYLAYWIKQLYPLYDPDNFYKKMSQANGWVDEYLPNHSDSKSIIEKDRVELSWFADKIKSVLAAMWSTSYGDLLESQSRKLQEYRLRSYLGGDYEDNEPHVIIKKSMIKLHKEDQREHFKRKWQQTFNKYLS